MKIMLYGLKRETANISSLLNSTLNTRALLAGNLKYIRSDFPERLTDDEVRWLLRNDITVIIDLREEKEYRKKHCRLEDEEHFSCFHMPVTGGSDIPKSPEAAAESYLAMVDTQMEKIIDTILTAGHNVLFFCSAGKDRTGVMSAVLLKRLGYDDKTIIDDYMKTKENLRDYLKSYAEEHPEVDINTIMPNERYIKAVLKVV